MEKISIVNFAGIKSMDFEFKSINILIGPQGSGKSVTIKLLYFFKAYLSDLLKSPISLESKRNFDKEQVGKFVKFFPKESWPKDRFVITYILDAIRVTIVKEGKQISISYSDNLRQLITRSRKMYAEAKGKLPPGEVSINSRLKLMREVDASIQELMQGEFGPIPFYNQLFIPAGRSFFANIQSSIYTFLSGNQSLDPFLIEFGAYYEEFKHLYYTLMLGDSPDKRLDDIIADVLGSSFIKEKDKDFLMHKDSRKVNLSNASSGQQETLPLVVTLGVLNKSIVLRSGATIYIEEPEAHLFPVAQKAIVQLLARTFNHPDIRYQIVVTTHSPYILSLFNNLMEAGRLRKIKPEESRKVSRIVPVREQIDPELVTAYSLKNGRQQSLIDDDSKLITQTTLDSISNNIATDFGRLLDIEF